MFASTRCLLESRTVAYTISRPSSDTDSHMMLRTGSFTTTLSNCPVCKSSRSTRAPSDHELIQPPPARKD